VHLTVGQRLAELYQYRELVRNLTVRDLKLKYKRSALGVAWSFLNPLLMMAVYTAVFSVLLRAVSLPRYWAFLLVGVLAWTFFANSLTGAVAVFVRNNNLITKVHFPIEALPIGGVLANFVNFLIMLAILLVILVIAGIPFGPSLILLPVVVLAELGLALGLSLVLATLTVHLRDVEHFTGIGLMAWFYLTPVLYPLDASVLPKGAGTYLPFLQLNPLAWYLECYQAVLYYGTWPPALPFTLMLATTLLALAGGYAFFARLRARLPEAV
jgi:ABC-type polysaccharide/polyol phosphate export permease